MTAPEYRGRFAPSPTGPLHFGSLLAATASFLDARSQHGEWWVRIEDLDPPREVAGAADDILRTLEQFGFEWDGPVWYQSARHDAYRSALADLHQLGASYPCGCTRREILEHSLMGRDGPIYPGTCRNGIPTGKDARTQRVKVDPGILTFVDRLQGRISQDLANEVGDFVIHRADGLFAYQLAVVVDDAAQGITDVVRGCDLLSSTPRQLYLQRLLGYATPRYLHIPIAVDADGSKLSKQTFAPAVVTSAPQAALIQCLSFLDMRVPTELHNATLTDLWAWAITQWQVDRLPRIRTKSAPHPLQE